MREEYPFVNREKRYMNEKKFLYEPPVTQVVAVNLEARILDVSLEGIREDYGTAITETWD